jgi:hypothetical protein
MEIKHYGGGNTMRFLYLKGIILLAVVLTVVGAVTVSAQTNGIAGNSSKSIFNVKKPEIDPRSLSLLDPDRFSMKQSYMVNFSSTGGSGGVMGMYINSMEYRFNAPLILRLKVAYQSQTGMLFGDKNRYTGLPNNQQGRLFIPSFDLVYKPWKNTTFGISYRDYSGMNMLGYNRYNRYNPYYYSPYYGGIDYAMNMQMYNMLYGYDQFDRTSNKR